MHKSRLSGHEVVQPPHQAGNEQLKGGRMQIVRAINNNIVSCLDENGQEVIVMGKGLGFHAKTCSEISESQIEKMFRMDSQKETDKLKALFSSP